MSSKPKISRFQEVNGRLSSPASSRSLRSLNVIDELGHSFDNLTFREADQDAQDSFDLLHEDDLRNLADMDGELTRANQKILIDPDDRRFRLGQAHHLPVHVEIPVGLG